MELNILKQMRRDVEYATLFRFEYGSLNSLSTCPTVADILEMIREGE